MSAFVHLELSTDDPTRASQFYKDLFGWKLKDMPMGDGNTYTMFSTPQKGPGGGISRKQMAEQPTAWLPYVGVKSVKDSMEKAKSLGATPVVEYQPVPGFGAMGIFVDPTGATFAVWEAAMPARKKVAKKSAPKKKAKKKGRR
jgi:predicted enzyme related to lactoylglutathione lyase